VQPAAADRALHVRAHRAAVGLPPQNPAARYSVGRMDVDALRLYDGPARDSDDRVLPGGVNEIELVHKGQVQS